MRNNRVCLLEAEQLNLAMHVLRGLDVACHLSMLLAVGELLRRFLEIS